MRAFSILALSLTSLCWFSIVAPFCPLPRLEKNRGPKLFLVQNGNDGADAKLDKDNKAKRGYQFGDITRGLAKKAGEKVNNLTGKDNYEFGDLTKFLGRQVKARVAELHGKEEGEYSYQVGDLTRWVGKAAQERLSNYTGKAQYQFGDITKEVIRRIQSGEYQLDDVLLALRILLSAGASLTPIFNILPLKLLLELVNLGLAGNVADRVLGLLATTLDSRMKEALTGDSNYQLGDLTKKRMSDELSKFTGKESYEIGDISRTIAKLASELNVDASNKGRKKDTGSLAKLEFSKDSALELEEWDKKFTSESS